MITSSQEDKWPDFPDLVGDKIKTQKTCPKCGKASLMVQRWGEFKKKGLNYVDIRITCANLSCKYQPVTRPELLKNLKGGLKCQLA